MDIKEEVEALESIYCSKDDEFCVNIRGWNNRTETVFTIAITKCDIKVMCIFTVKPTYPHTTPEVTFSLDAKYVDVQSLKQDLMDYCESLLGSPMLMEVVLWIKDNIHNYILVPEHLNSTSLVKDERLTASVFVTTLLSLDHMRAKNKYLKTLEKWCAELGVAVVVIFQDKCIYILLQGPESQVRQYIVLHKTVSVDVDSKGRSCKERMLTVLDQKALTEEQVRLCGFQVKEYASRQETESFFREMGLMDLYQVIL